MFEDVNNRGHLVKLNESTFVEQDVLRVVEEIRRMDPNLKVQFLNEAASVGDAPYRIIERCKDGEWRVIFSVWELDDRVLDRLRAADSHHADVLAALDLNNNAVRIQEGRRFREQMDEAQDIVKHIIASPKGRYTVNVDDPVKGPRKLYIDDDPKPSWRVEDAPF